MHRSPAHPLQAIVSDGRGGVQAFLDITRLQRHPAGSLVAPYAGVAIGLQLHPHRQLVDVVRTLLLAGADLFLDPGQVLHMMPYLVGDDIGLGEISGGSKAGMQVLEESQVEVDLLITRAVERSRSRLAG